MSIILYRRHGSGCPTKNPSAPEFALSHKMKRLFMGCACPIWVGGRIDGREVERQSLKTTDLSQAKRMVASVTGAGLAPEVEPDRGPRLADCIMKYRERRENELTDHSARTYRIVLGYLADYAAKKGIVYVRDLTVEFLENFKFDGMPKLADSSRGTYTNKLISFLYECERLGWVSARLADRIKRHHHEHETSLPFSDDDIEKLLNADNWRRAGGASATTYRLLFQLMLETGLRVSDAIQFDPAKLIRGEHLWIYPFRMTKRKKVGRVKTYEVFVTDPLKKDIEDARESWFGALPFRGPGTLHVNYNRVQREMARIGATYEIDDCRPHRLRDTFAVRRLLAGVGIEHVSRLLHHSSIKVTEQSYAAWVPARARQLEGIVAASLKPRVERLDDRDRDAQR